MARERSSTGRITSPESSAARWRGAWRRKLALTIDTCTAVPSVNKCTRPQARCGLGPNPGELFSTPPDARTWSTPCVGLHGVGGVRAGIDDGGNAMVLWGDNDETNRRLTSTARSTRRPKVGCRPRSWGELGAADVRFGRRQQWLRLGLATPRGRQELWLNRYDPFEQSWSVAQQVAISGSSHPPRPLPGNATFVWMEPGDASNSLAAEGSTPKSGETFSARPRSTKSPRR